MVDKITDEVNFRGAYCLNLFSKVFNFTDTCCL